MLVLEQHDQAGGCCHSFIDKVNGGIGWEVDGGREEGSEVGREVGR